MTIQLCPLYNSPYYTYTIDLDRSTFGLTFRYSSRSQGYLLDIFDAEENPIIRNIKLVPYYPLLSQYSIAQIPGDFLLLPIEETTIAESGVPDPRRVDRTHYLVYISPE